MDLRSLRYFVAVAEAGHMTRAAQQLGLQQPPLSQQIRALERELGVQLFRRHPKGVALTEAGRELLNEARRVLEAMNGLQAHMQRVAAGLRGLLRVGFTSSAAAHGFAPQVLSACRREYPEIELQISEDNAAGVIEAVAAGRMHCGFVRVPVARPEGVLFEALLSEPAVLVLPVDHALAARYGAADAVPLQALAGERLILVRRPGAPGLYANLLTLLDRLGVAVQVVAEVERMMTNINLVAAGSGVSIVPLSMRGAHERAVVYRPLQRHAALEAPITLAWRREDGAEATSTFLALARRIAACQAGESAPI
jgi:DNA-binding transcriptional LysR family regulator